MSLHVSTEIHAFFLASHEFGLGVALHRATKSPSYLVGVVGGWMRTHVLRPRYLVCYLRRALRRHPSTK